MRKLKFLITLIITVLIATGCASGGKEKPRKDNWNDFQTYKKVVMVLIIPLYLWGSKIKVEKILVLI